MGAIRINWISWINWLILGMMSQYNQQLNLFLAQLTRQLAQLAHLSIRQMMVSRDPVIPMIQTGNLSIFRATSGRSTESCGD